MRLCVEWWYQAGGAGDGKLGLLTNITFLARQTLDRPTGLTSMDDNKLHKCMVLMYNMCTERIKLNYGLAYSARIGRHLWICPKEKVSCTHSWCVCVCGVSVRNKRPWLHFIAPSARFRDAAATSFMGHYRTCESPSAERIVRVSRKCGSMLILPFGSNYLHNCEHKRASGVYDWIIFNTNS